MKLVALMILGLTSTTSYAICSQTDNQLSGLVGLDSSTGFVFASLKSEGNGCGCSHVRFKPQNTEVDMALSILMAAKVSSDKVRVDFKDSSEGVANCDSGYRVYLQ